jgi:hypothetical protein
MTATEYIEQHGMQPHEVYTVLYYEWKDGILNASRVAPRKVADLLKHYESVEDFEKCGDLSEWLEEANRR